TSGHWGGAGGAADLTGCEARMTDSRAMASPDDRRPIRARAGESPDLADTAEVQLTASPVKASATYVSDHVTLMDIPDSVYRLWAVCRAFIFDKDPASVSLKITDHELAALMHRSVSAVRKIRERAYAYGLLAEESRITESYRGPNGRNQVRTVRKLRVLHIEAPDDYDGPLNIFAERRRIQGVSAGRTDCPKSSTQYDQGKRENDGANPEAGQPSDQHKHDICAGRTECYFLDNSCPKMGNSCPKMGKPTPSDQRKPAPQTPSSRNLSTNQPASAVDVTPGTGSGSGRLAGEAEEEHDKAAAVLASLPVRTPLPASTVRTLTPPVPDLLTSGWTPRALPGH